MEIHQIGTRKVPDIYAEEWNFHVAWKVPEITDELLDVYGRFVDVEQAVGAAKRLMSAGATFATVSRRDGMSMSSRTLVVIRPDGTTVDMEKDPYAGMALIEPGFPWAQFAARDDRYPKPAA